MLSLVAEVIDCNVRHYTEIMQSFICQIFIQSFSMDLFVTFMPRDTNKNKVTTLFELILN